MQHKYNNSSTSSSLLVLILPHTPPLSFPNAQVEFSCQALAKALYERMFKWVVQRTGSSFIGIYKYIVCVCVCVCV